MKQDTQTKNAEPVDTYFKMAKLEALHNAVISADFPGLKVYEKYVQDKRETIKRFFLNINNETISPVLDYENMNHFILGFSKAKAILNRINKNMKQQTDNTQKQTVFDEELQCERTTTDGGKTWTLNEQDNTQDKQVSSHTPGWIVEPSAVIKSSKVLWDTRFVIDQLAKRIAMVYGETIKEAEANAELIASAPELKAENEKLKADNTIMNNALKAFAWGIENKEINSLYQIKTLVDIALNKINQ